MRPDWNTYNQWNQRHRGMSELWVRDVVAWLVEDRRVGPNSAVLDYGCSWFDVGAALASLVRRMDGFDIDGRAIDVARRRTAESDHVTLYEDVAQVPASTYDVIVVNSVLQYMQDEAQVALFLQRARAWLVPSADAFIVVADLIPPAYSPARDAVDSLCFATRHGMLWPMVTHLWKAARKPVGHDYLRLAPDSITRLARAAGLTCRVLERNLTPSRRRYSCCLSPV